VSILTISVLASLWRAQQLVKLEAKAALEK